MRLPAVVEVDEVLEVLGALADEVGRRQHGLSRVKLFIVRTVITRGIDGFDKLRS